MFHRSLTLVTAVALGGLSAAAPGQPLKAPWVLVDTHRHTVSVIQGGKVKQTFRRIAVGRGGVAKVRYEGGGRTPLGTFHVAWVNKNSRFHLFFGLDYPHDAQAEVALKRNKIGPGTYARILRAYNKGRLPPQNTKLGGYIGIHGLGHANPVIQRMADWTEGCIALDNRQIDDLAQWVSIGTKVVIR